jgi:signal transduction histidine kinase/CheY-like chemotaxis protein
MSTASEAQQLGARTEEAPAAGDVSASLLYLATAQTTPWERRAAWIVAIVSALVFVALVPFARVKLVEIPSFIPGYVATLVVISLVTAVILVGQYVRLRSPAILALAAGYFFDAAILVPYFLSFPGMFGEGTLIGGFQTTPWMYTFWHAGFPLFVVAYAVLRNADGAAHEADPLGAIVGAIAFVVVVVLAMTVAATAGHDLLPPILDGNLKTPVSFYILGAAWAVSVAALGVLWWKGIRSVLDIWVCVVLVAWICDIALSAVLNAGRYDVGYYFGRLYGLMALSFVLGLVLLETTGLQGRMADAAEKLSGEVKQVRDRARLTEEQLRQAQKMEAIGNLTGGMAHDFNNLLAIVIGNLDILVDRKKGDTDVRELGGEALEAALRGADLTQRMLAFARRQPLQPRPVDLNALIAELDKLLSRTLGENIEISLDLDPELWPTVVDPSQLDAALTNLATNARDVMPDGGSLIVVTGNRRLDADYAAEHAEVVPGDYAMIEVSDTGIGMEPAVVERVFEPFFTTKEHGKGTGLGLSMVYGFIKQSGGHINVYSEPGIGTTFRLYLPRSERGDATAGAAAAAETTSGRGETVLAVEDNASLRRVVVRQLHELGYRVLEAESAPAAMKILEREPVDLLFTDVVMTGGSSGIELARDALARWPQLKVLITSGFPEVKLNGNGRAAIPARLLNKPYRKEDLARAIRETMGG